MRRCVLPVFLSAMISVGSIPIAAFAATGEPQLNFKIYSPESASSTPAASESTTEAAPASPTGTDNILPAMESSTGAATAPAAAAAEATPAADTTAVSPVITPTPEADASATAPASMESAAAATTEKAAETPVPAAAETPVAAETPAPVTTPSASSTTDVPLRTETPVEAAPAKAAEAEPAASPAVTTTAKDGQAAGDTTAAAEGTDKTEKAAAETTEKTADSKTLQGYIRVVPSGTKIPIIMDTAVDSETSQEGDEFTARTSEDLNIDGGVAVPAGSIIKGRIAQMNAPKHMDRSGSVALKFDTVTTPDNRQIPLVANLVSHGGVVHAKRGLKDIAIDSSTVVVPFVIGLGIGALAGNSKSSTTTTTSSSSISKGEAAAIGAAIGLVVGVAILCAKKGKKVDVRPGDELKIELAEDLRMPMM